MCLKVTLLNLLVLKAVSKCGFGMREINAVETGDSPGAQLQIPALALFALYCQLGVKPPVLSFVSSACPMQRMHPHSMMQYSHKKAALLQVY